MGILRNFARLYHNVGRADPYLRVKTIPILKDNYSYALIDDANQQMHIVDPAEPHVVMEALKPEFEDNGIELMSLLTTHKHPDHMGGNTFFADRFPGLDIIGPRLEQADIPCITTAVVGGDVINPGKSNLSIQVLDTSCHTKGHVSFFVEALSGQPPILFAGDVITVGGCGRFFEGTAVEMYRSLYTTLTPLPDNTRIYPGHEYTLNNLSFCQTIEPENLALLSKLEWAKSRRGLGMPTVPTSLYEEKEYNVFLRCHEEPVMKMVGETDPVEVLAELRKRKDNF